MLMLDSWWRQAVDALVRNSTEGDRVLLPAGDWPDLPYGITTYRNTDVNISVSGYSAILIHKGMLTSFRQSDVRACLKDMAVVCANAVFVVFVLKPRIRGLFLPVHLRSLKIYADPLQFRRRGNHPGAFLHIPKTGGTSIWERVSRSVRSSVYFSSNHALSAFEGDINAFEVLGGHFQAETLVAKGWQGSVFFVLRDPIERVLSSVAHARRPHENVALFDQSYRTMRRLGEGPLDAVQRDLLFHESNMQVRMLGERPGEDLHDPQTLSTVCNRALERLRHPEWRFGLLDCGDLLARQVARQFGLRPVSLPHLNRTEDRGGTAACEQIREYLVGGEAACMDMVLYSQASRYVKTQ